MILSWNEIKKRAIEFSAEWANAESEISEKQTFWNEFFNVFGINRKRVAIFEQAVNKLGNKKGFIDLFWPQILIVEHKSSGHDLDKAYDQTIDYTYGLQDFELPKYVIVSNFKSIRIYDLEENTQNEFELKYLHKYIKLFGFIAGYRKAAYQEEDPANIKAAELMGNLHDKLLESGYKGHALEVYLVRILFCLFADDTNIFEKRIFTELIEQRTSIDGSDSGLLLANLFQVLNTPEEKRQTTLDEQLNQFPYVNGQLFEETLPIAQFNSEMRFALLTCCSFDWSKISPAVFGSLFQSVMDVDLRRNLGAHYTTEKNILKLTKSLFLDEFHDEFDRCKGNRNKLIKFHNELATKKFLDPACGCGNFLVITYRELRLLELRILKELYKDTNQIGDFNILSQIDVDQFFGIELEEFPARIAEVAMWLVDHQMNMLLSETFGNYYVRLPLKKAAKIVIGNSLRINWEDVVQKDQVNYILGNPPFVGKAFQNEQQKSDMDLILNNIDGAGVLDYVSCWYIKAAELLSKNTTDEAKERKIKVGFVSTNSISQGEQVGILWNELFTKYKIKIHFAHRTFKWSSEARGGANVFVVIIGFSNFDINNKVVFDYDSPTSDAHILKVKNINGYLVEGNDIVIVKRNEPICNVNPIIFGNMPNDGGNLLMNDEEKEELLRKEPKAKKFVRPLISAREYLNNVNRWCLWLKDINPNELRQLPEVLHRVEAVKKHRLSSKRAATRKLAKYPTLFGEIRQLNNDYIFVPLTTSENRDYIPMSFFTKENIVNNTSSIIPNATLYEFGILLSKIHMVWVKYICGRLKGDFRYSNELVYNNFPWPENPSKTKQNLIKQKAQKVLTVRKKFSSSSLADLYDPIAMPPELTRAHKELDKAVDSCFRSKPFRNDASRIEFLFELYEKYTNPLMKNSGASSRNSFD